MTGLLLIFLASLLQAAPADAGGFKPPSEVPGAVKSPALRWGADSEGGAPFVFQNPADPSKLVGCEVELMAALGAQMGRETKFVQNTWDGLIPGLRRGNYDLAINAIEITADRAEVVSFSNPYYVSYEQLVVREDEYGIQELNDLKGRVVGTFKGALAQRILESSGKMDIRLYESVEPAYRDLLNGRVEAVLMDHPLALYFATPLPGLKFVGGPIARFEYGIALRKDDPALLGQVNRALGELKKNGKLREIFERWGMWTGAMAEWTGDYRNEVVKPEAWKDYLHSRGAVLDWEAGLRRYVGYLPMLARGAWVTLELSVLGMGLAMGMGMALALGKLYGPWWLRWAAVAYIELFRGTPLLIQLFIIFYGLPYFGLKFPPFAAAVLGLGLNYAAYEAENYRAGILSVAQGQGEAALALGMSRGQSLRYIVLPQALRLSLPPVTNDFISIIKDSSLVSVITMVELTKVYGQLASATYDWMGLGVLTAGMYFLVGWPFVLLARRLELKISPKPFSRSS